MVRCEHLQLLPCNEGAYDITSEIWNLKLGEIPYLVPDHRESRCMRTKLCIF